MQRRLEAILRHCTTGMADRTGMAVGHHTRIPAETPLCGNGTGTHGAYVEPRSLPVGLVREGDLVATHHRTVGPRPPARTDRAHFAWQRAGRSSRPFEIDGAAIVGCDAQQLPWICRIPRVGHRISKPVSGTGRKNMELLPEKNELELRNRAEVSPRVSLLDQWRSAAKAGHMIERIGDAGRRRDFEALTRPIVHGDAADDIAALGSHRVGMACTRHRPFVALRE